MPEIRQAVIDKKTEITAYVVKEDGLREFTLKLGELTDEGIRDRRRRTAWT